MKPDGITAEKRLYRARKEVLVIGNRWDDAVLIEGGEDQK